MRFARWQSRENWLPIADGCGRTSLHRPMIAAAKDAAESLHLHGQKRRPAARDRLEAHRASNVHIEVFRPGWMRSMYKKL